MTRDEGLSEIRDLLAAYSDRYQRWLCGYEKYGYAPADDRRSVAVEIYELFKEVPDGKET